MIYLVPIWLTWLAGILLVVAPLRWGCRWRLPVALAVLAAGATILFRPPWNDAGPLLFAGSSLRWDRYAAFLQLIVLGCAAVGLALAGRGEKSATLAGLTLLSAAGACFCSVANDLVVLVAGVVVGSLPGWVAAVTEGARGREAAMKGLLAVLPAVGLAGLGAALWMARTGSTGLTTITSVTNELAADPWARAAFLIWLLGMVAMLAAAPWHMWFVDLIDGLPPGAACLLGGGALLVMLAGVGRALVGVAQTTSLLLFDWSSVLHVVGLFSLLVGSLSALGQKKLKRLLANLAVGQVGFMLLGLAAAGRLGGTDAPAAAEALGALLVFLVVSSLTWLGFWLALAAIVPAGNEPSVDHLAGLGARQPGLALAVGLALLCAAGMPPTVGFLARLWMFEALVNAGWSTTALVSALTLALVMATCLNWVAAMVRGGEPEQPRPVSAGVSRLLSVLMGGLLVLLSFLPEGLFAAAVWAAKAVF